MKLLHHLRGLWRTRSEFLFLERQRQVIKDTLTAPPLPQLTAEHVAMMRALRVKWSPVESGAPGLRQWFPFGLNRLTRTVGFETQGLRDEVLLARTIVEVAQWIPLLISNGVVLQPGRYSVPADMRDYFAFPESGVSPDGFFEFCPEHMTLLGHFNWRFEQLEPPCWPMPHVDGKYPYGDCSYYQIDMAAHLGSPYVIDAQGDIEVNSAHDEELADFHSQMLVALQVFLLHAKFPACPSSAPDYP